MGTAMKFVSLKKMYAGTYQIDKEQRTVTLRGTGTGGVHVDRVDLIAPAPADFNSSFSGSGLPFPRLEDAMWGTPNYAPNVDRASWQVTFEYPNAFMTNMGSERVPPTVFIRMETQHDGTVYDAVELPDMFPYRSLTYPERRKQEQAMFYDNMASLPTRGSQYEAVLSSAFCLFDTYPPNHWGQRPSV